MVNDFLKFVEASPTAYQAVESITALLSEAGFERLEETGAWNIAPGGKYFVTRNGSSVIAFALPKDAPKHFQIVASHSDSPALKLKPLCEDVSAGYVRLNVERYGGMIFSTWFDRPLSIAGRLVVKEGDCIRTQLVDLGRDAVLIPNMPIHFNREVNDGYKYNAQVDLLPIYAQGEPGGLMKELASKAGVVPEAVIGADLFLYNRVPGSIWGEKNEFFSCGRIDDLECAYISVKAFIGSECAGHVNVCAVFDNEEVGSGSKQGADSTFLTDVLGRIGAELGRTECETRAMIASSFLVSADNAHAVHPNHPEKYDAQNRTRMNGGVVIKHNANQKYTTDGVSAAIFAAVCEKAGVPVQHFANRSDVLGGSTLGHIANTHASMNSVDIGLAQLAMHSAYETAGTADVRAMTDALTAFCGTDIAMEKDGAFKLS